MKKWGKERALSKVPVFPGMQCSRDIENQGKGSLREATTGNTSAVRRLGCTRTKGSSAARKTNKKKKRTSKQEQGKHFTVNVDFWF